MDLTGKLLIAMPGMGDPRFERSVVFMCTHTRRGAMGLIVNKPASDLTFATLLDQLEIPHGPESAEIRVHFGGPVENARGFVLHSPDYEGRDTTLEIDDRFAMTGTMDILCAMAEGLGPQRAFVALGYSGWGAGQLEDEILQNGWLTAEATPDLVFDRESASKWERALRSLGVDPITLSAAAGRA